ncbi:NAD(P)/FAD-dependent oxidoreductase [Microcystis aeruginosa CS-564/01]|uniref:NAD(P)/FAD-dependent oxidoreductase n=1 Tax=Microcystis aeruginosa TaxID=1126 RepID=UPI00232E18FC|nr:NAD(P)/FAD-dependent oxidoreductase [Microcystis aeruginosa]MDB9425546.1 NAD(P)/FAD-dependent oxidoreductase [Microcystis aeruginosa CS-564/01]
MDYDVVIIGGGPAGGHCGRLLSEKGYRVLLVEQHSSWQDNNFSSAASPLEILEQFNLPETIVARFWKNIEIISTSIHRSWSSAQPLGVVFDFAKLREFLAAEVLRWGGEVRLGCRYLKYQQTENQLTVFLKSKGEKIETVTTRLLVDATGYARAVMYKHRREKPDFLKGVGIEYLIAVPEGDYQKYQDNLVFFLGHKWSPKGYGWIFPMDNQQLKIGAAWLEGEHPYISEVKPLKSYIIEIIKDYMNLDNYDLVEQHGSIVEYSSGLQDIYYKKPNIIAIGDAVSTINALGGEGIRHAMKGAEIACQYMEEYLQGKSSNFAAYQQRMQEYFQPKWNLSDRLSRKVYLEYSDARIDQGVSYLKYLSTQDIIDVLFYYKFEKYTKGLGGFLLGKLRQWWRKIFPSQKPE